MGNLNKVLLMGNLTRDPELRYIPSGTPVCEFGIAVNRSYTGKDGTRREEALFVDVSMWGKRGVAVSEYFSKGRAIFIEGRLKYDTWETPEGKRSKVSVVAENFQFVGPPQEAGQSGRRGAPQESGGQRGQQPPGGPAKGKPPQESAPSEEKAEEGFDVSDEEIPF